MKLDAVCDWLADSPALLGAATFVAAVTVAAIAGFLLILISQTVSGLGVSG